MKEIDYDDTVIVSVRVVVGEEQRATVELSCSCNDKIKNIAEEMAEFFNEKKYKLSFISESKTLKMSDSIAEMGISKLLCVKGGDNGPKIF